MKVSKPLHDRRWGDKNYKKIVGKKRNRAVDKSIIRKEKENEEGLFK